MAAKAANTPHDSRIQALVKNNEVLDKKKPRWSPEGSAHDGVTTCAITALIYSSGILTHRSIKKGCVNQLEDRVGRSVQQFIKGEIASNDYGAFDSSIVDNGNLEAMKSGLRGCTMCEKPPLTRRSRKSDPSTGKLSWTPLADVQETDSHL